MKKKIPFDFILDLLSPLSSLPSPQGEGLGVRQMFGCHAIYLGGKIMLIVRKKENHKDANGVWIATAKEHHESLKKELPSMKSVYILSDNKGETGWQMIHENADDFEESVAKICGMILKEDERIGKIPKKKNSTLPSPLGRMKGKTTTKINNRKKSSPMDNRRLRPKVI